MQQAQPQPFSNRRGHAADASEPRLKPRVVFPFKQSYCHPVNGSRPLCLGGPPKRALEDELHHRAHHRPAPEPRAHAWLRRFAAQARHGVHQLEAGARTAQRHGAAEAPGRGFARAAPRSCRRHRGSGQYRHGRRVPARGVVDGDVGRSLRRQLRARQSRRLCARVHAAARGDVRALDLGRPATRRSRPTLICAFAGRSRSSA